MRIACTLLAILACTAPAGAGSGFRFGSFERAIERLGAPGDVAIDAAGRIYVTQSRSGDVAVVSRDGTRSLLLRDTDPDVGLVAPRGVAVDGDEVFVTDVAGHRVHVFGSDGTLARRWGGHGFEPGAFLDPAGIAVRGDRVFVADSGNDRVQVFSRDGAFLMALGGSGRGPGEMTRPSDVAIASDGSIVVADAGNDRIQVYASDGGFVRQWGDWGAFPGLMDDPGCVAIDGDRVHVVDTRNHRVQTFALDGTVLDLWGVHEVTLHEGGGKLHYPAALAIDAAGAFAVIVEPIEDRLQVIARLGEGEEPAEPSPPQNKANQTHFGDHVSVDGRLMAIADPEIPDVILFDLAHEVPIVTTRFGGHGSGFGLMRAITGVDVDVRRLRVQVADALAGRVQEFALDFDVDGRVRFIPFMASFARSVDLAWVWDHLDERRGWSFEPGALLGAEDGAVLHLADRRNDAVIAIDRAGRVVRWWGGHGTAPGQFRGPTALAFSSDRTMLFAADRFNSRVQAFTPEGRFLFSFGGGGAEPGRLSRPFGVAAGGGFVYVTDEAADRVLKYDETGRFVAGWGTRGSELGELWAPRGIALDDRGRVIVVDFGNHRGQIFGPDGEWLVTFGTGMAYTPENRPRGPG